MYQTHDSDSGSTIPSTIGTLSILLPSYLISQVTCTCQISVNTSCYDSDPYRLQSVAAETNRWSSATSMANAQSASLMKYIICDASPAVPHLIHPAMVCVPPQVLCLQQHQQQVTIICGCLKAFLFLMRTQASEIHTSCVKKLQFGSGLTIRFSMDPLK